MFVAVLSGCVIAVGTDEFRDDSSKWKKTADANKRDIHRLDVGRSPQAVVDEMGQPDISEAFTRDGKMFRVYYYRTRQVHSDSTTTKDETTPLVFVDDRLVGWGDTAIEYATVN